MELISYMPTRKTCEIFFPGMEIGGDTGIYTTPQFDQMSTSALAERLSVNEARQLHNRIMSYIISTKYVGSSRILKSVFQA